MADGNNTYPFDASDVANPLDGTFTQEQKEALAAEWNVNHESMVDEKQVKADAAAQKATDKASGNQKLLDLGLSQAEVDAL